jgi:hypothetical protein
MKILAVVGGVVGVSLGGMIVPASAVTTTSCTGFSGTNSLSPGIISTASNQSITSNGSITGCAGGGVTGGTWFAGLNTVSGVSCTTPTPAAGTLLATGKFRITWNTGQVSGGPLKLKQWRPSPPSPPREWASGARQKFRGQVTSGLFAGDDVKVKIISTWPSSQTCPTLTQVIMTIAPSTAFLA